MKYLKTTADLTFKRVFGEHPDLMISLLNALLPLDADKQVVRIEYLSSELVPETLDKKDSIVDVRCFDQENRQFVVEMQMSWTTNFMQRVLFNASKAYVKQLDKGGGYDSLHPVYALSFINDIFEKKMETWYHHYALVHRQDTGKVIDGLQLIFIELPKFKPETFSGKKMQVLWLRFLTEIDEKTTSVPEELMNNPEVKKALGFVRESAFTPGELLAYDQYWDSVSTERTLMTGKWQEGKEEGIEIGEKKGIEIGKAEGIEIGKAEGIEIGKAEGREEERKRAEQDKRELARKMISDGIAPEVIAKYTGLGLGEIAEGLIDK